MICRVQNAKLVYTRKQGIRRFEILFVYAERCVSLQPECTLHGYFVTIRNEAARTEMYEIKKNMSTAVSLLL
jgi:hypothetical protein